MSTQASRTHREDSTKGWRRPAVGTAAAALVAAVTLAGCGLGGSSSDSAVPRSEGATFDHETKQWRSGTFATADRQTGMTTFMSDGPGKAVFEGR